MLYRARRGDPAGERLFKKFHIRSTPFLLFLRSDGTEVDWISGYTPPPEKLRARILRILEGVETLPSLTEARTQDPKNPEPLIKLGLKYQERQNRDKALALFKAAAALDPDGKRMMKRESGGAVSCKEMADYQHARTFIATFGMMDINAVKAYIRHYPSGRLLKEAYLEISRFYRLADEEGRAFFDELISKFPDDPDVLKAYLEKVNDPAASRGASRAQLQS